MAPRRVLLHVGAPKSGTTYLQERLARNARRLARHGLAVPTTSPLVRRPTAQFRAALDVLGQDWGGPPGHAEGSWDRILDRVERAPQAAVVVSHEILAPAPRAVTRRAVADLAATGREVHVVLTARDLGGSLASAWQESVKQGRRWTFGRFLDLAEREQGWWFHALDLPRVLERWGEGLAPERVHLVTVPRDGSDALWPRFAGALGVDPALAPRRPRESNASLGVVETAVLRHLNEATGRERADHHRDRRVAQLLGPGGLGERRSPRVAVPPARRAWLTSQADRWRAHLADHPVTVHGSLDDLVPDAVPGGASGTGTRPTDWVDPDAVPEPEVLARAEAVLARLAGSGGARR